MEITLQFKPGMDPEDALVGATAALAEELGVPVEILESNLWDLDKAVAAHPAQFQPRSKRGAFVKRHPSRLTPRDERGRFRQRLSREECRDAVGQAGAYIDGPFASRLQDHIADFGSGGIGREEWERRCERDIRDAYERLYRLGKQSVGDPAVTLTPQDKAVLNRLIEDELGYLRQFGHDAEEGAGTMPYAERMGLYARAGREAFILGWVLGDQRKGREVRWAVGPTEHCRDCLAFDAMGWMPVQEFIRRIVSRGYVPKSGALECKGIHCRCVVRERINGVLQPDVVLPGVSGA